MSGSSPPQASAVKNRACSSALLTAVPQIIGSDPSPAQPSTTQPSPGKSRPVQPSYSCA